MIRKTLFLISLIVIGLPSIAAAQAWSGILDPSRATNWSTAGFTVPSYTAPCPTQPTLLAGSGNSAVNATAIASAIASCGSSQVVNIPSGTFYTAGINFGGKSNVVVRGAGPMSTYLYLTPPAQGCYGYSSVGVCMGGNPLFAQSSLVQPGGSTVCSWTGGYAQGSTTITLNSCGSAPPVGLMLVLDQANDSADNGGPVNCDTYNQPAWICTQKGTESSANADGRVIGGLDYSQQQIVIITGVSGSGSGPYTVTISPGVYFNNIRSSQKPGAWWATSNVTHEGIENLTLDHSTDTASNIGQLMIWCNQCWFQNNRSLYGLENHTDAISAFQPVFQNNYFYGSQHAGSESYCVQMEEVSAGLVQNNIMQNVTSPDIKDAVTGTVSAYNFTPYINFGNYMQGLYASHNSGSAFNLLEGNATTEFLADDIWGTSNLITIFRNHADGWQPGYTMQTYPFSINAGMRGVNIIGNVLGEPGYATQYQAYATSTTAGVYSVLHGGATSAGSGNINQSIYEVGWTDTSGLGVCTPNPVCDPLSWSTLMRWGNYDVVNGTVIWDSKEAAPASVPYINANPAPASETLPCSFYLNCSTKPSWFGSIPFPPYGPDVSGGSTGICTSGTYRGLWVTNSSQCAGGSYTASAWGGHANANPAQVCYLTVMNGPPDGSGGVLTYNPNACYNGAPAPPTNVNATGH